MPDIFPTDVLYALLDRRYRGEYGFATLAELNAVAADYGDGVILRVTNDPIPTNNGEWRKQGAVWVQALVIIDSRLINSFPLGYAFSIVDSAGRAALGIKDDGTVEVFALAAAEMNGNAVGSKNDFAGFAYVIADAAGHAAFGIKDDGTVVAKNLEIGGVNVQGNWATARWATLGDSITWLNGYQPLVQAALGIGVVNNYGSNGGPMTAGGATDLISITKVGKTIDNTATYVSILAGTNDFKLGMPLGALGVIGDAGFNINTFYGAYRSLIEDILTKNPGTSLSLWTPMQRDEAGYDVNYVNAAGLKLVDYVNAVTALGSMYSLPVLDLFRAGGITKLTLATYTYDGLHPSAAGFARMTKAIVEFLKSM